MALVDRTCLGVKSAFAGQKVTDAEVDDLLEDIGVPHGGMEACEPLTAQSIVYHAIDSQNPWEAPDQVRRVMLIDRITYRGGWPQIT